MIVFRPLHQYNVVVSPEVSCALQDYYGPRVSLTRVNLTRTPMRNDLQTSQCTSVYFVCFIWRLVFVDNKKTPNKLVRFIKNNNKSQNVKK